MRTIKFEIIDDSCPVRTLKGGVEIYPAGIGIYAEGYGQYGDIPKQGLPIWIEYYGGRLTVALWPDINEEEPIKTDLEGARECLYAE